MAYDYSESFGFLLSRAAGVLKNRFHSVLRGYEITPEQMAVMLCLSEKQGISPSILSEVIAKDKPNTVRIVEKIRQKGFITIQENPEDRRSYLVYLAEKGAALQESVIPIADKLIEQALKDFDSEEVEQFKVFLDRMHKNLE